MSDSVEVKQQPESAHSSQNISVKLPDGSVKEVPRGTTALDVARSISPRLADAALVAKGFPHGLLVQIPHGTHNGEGDCQERVIADFVERGSVEGLDVSCLKTARPVPFVTRPEKPE